MLYFTYYNSFLFVQFEISSILTLWFNYLRHIIHKNVMSISESITGEKITGSGLLLLKNVVQFSTIRDYINIEMKILDKNYTDIRY